MFFFYTTRFYLLLFAALWTLSYPILAVAWPGLTQSKSKDDLDPNVREWGDYSDIPPGTEQELDLDEVGEHKDEGGDGDFSSLAPELEFLAEFAGMLPKCVDVSVYLSTYLQLLYFTFIGKNRLWVITAPSHHDHYLRMMEKQLEDMDQVLPEFSFHYHISLYIFFCFLFFSEKSELPSSRKRYLHNDHYPECYDGRSYSENNFPRRCHSREPGF